MIFQIKSDLCILIREIQSGGFVFEKYFPLLFSINYIYGNNNLPQRL